jgi:hypothetical protein
VGLLSLLECKLAANTPMDALSDLDEDGPTPSDAASIGSFPWDRPPLYKIVEPSLL